MWFPLNSPEPCIENAAGAAQERPAPNPQSALHVQSEGTSG